MMLRAKKGGLTYFPAPSLEQQIAELVLRVEALEAILLRDGPKPKRAARKQGARPG